MLPIDRTARFILVFISLTATIMAMAQNKLYLTVGNRTMTATLAENAATRSLVRLLESEPVTVNMSDYGSFEKVGELPQSLPASDSRITATPGDIMLYQGQNMVIFYGSNTWSYTPLGKIDGMTAASLREFLGNGNVDMTLSVSNTSGLADVDYDKEEERIVYDLQGNRLAEPHTSGIYIINGKKVFIMLCGKE